MNRPRIALAVALCLAVAPLASAHLRPVDYRYSPSPLPLSTPDPLGWINAQRAARGLAALAFDPAMAAVASANNAAQRARGMGHFVRGDRRQDVGAGPIAAILPAWAASGPHAAALFDPSLTGAAVAFDGLYATFSAR